MKINRYKIISKLAYWLMLFQVMMVIWILILAITWLVLNLEQKKCLGSNVSEKSMPVVEEAESESKLQISDEQDTDQK